MKVMRIVANIKAQDIQSAKTFYGDVMGLDLVMDMGWIATFQTENLTYPQLSVASHGGSSAPVPDVTIEVDDIEQALYRIKKARIAIEYGPATEAWGVRRFYVRDPFGRLLNIMQHLSAD